MSDRPKGLEDRRLAGYTHRVVTHGPAGSLEEAALMRGIEPAAVIKTMVVRRADDDYVFVLVPGDRMIDWPKVRAILDQRRLSLAAGEEAFNATGYRPGTITPLGASREWPVFLDRRLAAGEVSISAGQRGWSIAIDGSDLVQLLSADVADLTKPAMPANPD